MESQQQLPTVSKYFGNVARNKAPKPSKTDLMVNTVRESQSGNCLLIVTSVCVGFINADSKAFALIYDCLSEMAHSLGKREGHPCWVLTRNTRIKAGFDIDEWEAHKGDWDCVSEDDEPFRFEFVEDNSTSTPTVNPSKGTEKEINGAIKQVATSVDKTSGESARRSKKSP